MEQKKFSLRRVLLGALILVGFCAALLLIFVAALPSILSTRWGKETILSLYKKQKIEVNSLSLSWWGGQEAQGVKVLDAQMHPFFTVESIKTDASLWQLLWTRDVGEMDIRAPRLFLKSQPPVTTTAAPASAPSEKRKETTTTVSLFTGKVHVQDAEIDVETAGLDPIAFRGMNIESTLIDSSLVDVNATGNSVQGNLSGQFTIHGKADLSNLQAPSIDLQATIQGLPVRGVDQLLALAAPTYAGLLLEGIGQTMDLTLSGKLAAKEGSLNLQLTSPNCKGGLQATSSAQGLSLTAPAQFSVTLTPALITKLSPLFPEMRGIGLKTPTIALLKVESCQIPLAASGYDFQNSLFSGNLSLSQASALYNGQEIALSTFDIGFSTQNLQQSLNVELSTTAQFPGSSFFSELFGPSLTFSARGNLAGASRTLTVAMQSPQCTLQPVSFTLGEMLTLTTPASLSLTPSAALLTQWGLLQAAPIQLTIDKAQIPMRAPISQMTLHGTLSESLLRSSQVNLDALVCTLDISTWSKIQLQIQEKRLPAAALVTLNLSASPENWQNNLKLTGEAHFKGLLSSVIGPSVDLHFQAEKSPQRQAVTVSAESAQMQLNGSFSLKQEQIRLEKPLTAHLTVTPDGYAALDRWLTKEETSPFLPTEPIDLNLSLTQLKGSSSSLSQLQLAGSLQLTELSLQERQTKEVVGAKNLSLSFSKDAAEAPLIVNLKSSVSYKGKEGQISLDGRLTNFFSQTGAFDLTHLSTDLNAQLQQFPVLLCDLIARTRGNTNAPFTSLLGATTNATLMAKIQNMTGPVSLKLFSPTTQVNLVGELSSGVLTLNEPLFAQMKITKELSEYLIKEVNPLSISAVAAKNPMTLTIDPKGFSVPLFPLIMNQVYIPNGRLELGQVTCLNKGNLNLTLALLKQKFSNDKQINIWFAPIDFHIKTGICDVERTEVLVSDTFDIASWGSIDLAKRYVDMTLGLTASCLREAFGIKNLPANYVLQIPMKGPMDNVEMNTAAATTKVAMLLAWQHSDVLGGLGGGGVGALAGKFLGAIATLPDKDSKAPPAKHPFPWEEDAEPKKKTSGGKEIDPEDPPLKQLWKILG